MGSKTSIENIKETTKCIKDRFPDIYRIILGFLEPNILHIVLDLTKKYMEVRKIFLEECKKGHFDIINYLIEKYNDTECFEEDTSFSYSMIFGYILDWCGQALVIASEDGKLDVVKLLASKGIHISVYDDAFIKASMNGHLDIVKFLVKKGVNPDTCDGVRAMYEASENGHLDIVKYLVKKGVHPNIESDYAFYLAVQYGHLDIVRYFVSKGADVSVYDDADFENIPKRSRKDIVDYIKSIKNR